MINQDHFASLLYRTCLLGSFLGITATIYFLAGLSGHVENAFLNVTTAAALLLTALFFLYVFFLQMWIKSWLGFATWLLIFGILLAEVVLGLVPPAVRDELTHHLAIPKLYVESGRILEIPFAPYSYYPMLLDMLYTPFVKWGWDSIPKLIHGLFGFLTGLLLYSYLARRLSPVYGLLGFFFFVSTPAILRLSNLAYVDLGLVFYSTASLLSLLWWRESGYSQRWLILAGLSSGFALTTKPNGMLVFLLLFSLVAFNLGGEKERSIGQKSSWLFLFLFFVFLPLSPWLLKNMTQTGNPFFPFFTGLFSSGGGGSGLGGGSLGIFTKRYLLYGESGWQIAALPLRIFFSGQLIEGLLPERWGSMVAHIGGRDDSAQYFDGVLNPLLILCLPWAFKGKWIEEKKLFFAFAIVFFLYALFLVDLRIRYILPIVPPLVVLLVYGIHNIYLRIIHPSLLVGAVIVLVALNGIYFWNYFHLVSPVNFLTGKESRESFLTRMLPDYPSIQYINQNLPPTARVYFILMGRRGYYSQRDYYHDSGDNPWHLLGMIMNSQSEEGIKEKLREKGLTHLLVREDLLEFFLASKLTPDKQRVWNSFVVNHLKGLFRDRRYSVYQIHG
ncbi:MAG: phospholipid carrier-dependent glycosyltransferase [Candidatus Binatia bacterium]